MKAKLTVNKDLLRRFNRKLNTLKNREVEVGHFEGEKHPTADVDYATLAKWMEYGTEGGIKAYRPLTRLLFMFPLEEDLPLRKLILQYLTSPRGSVEELLGKIGEKYVRILKDIYGDTTILPSNSLETIKRKGGRNTPLVDSEFLREAISYKTRRK